MPASRGSGRARKEVSSGGVVFHQTTGGSQFALIKANGHWLFPKGNIEKGETPEVAALREISEETGLALDQLRIVARLPSIEYAFRWQGRLVFKTVHNFLVELLGDASFRPQLSEVEEAKWFSGPAARRALSFKNSQATLEAAIEAVDGWRVAS